MYKETPMREFHSHYCDVYRKVAINYYSNLVSPEIKYLWPLAKVCVAYNYNICGITDLNLPSKMKYYPWKDMTWHLISMYVLYILHVKLEVDILVYHFHLTVFLFRFRLLYLLYPKTIITIMKIAKSILNFWILTGKGRGPTWWPCPSPPTRKSCSVFKYRRYRVCCCAVDYLDSSRGG